MTLLEKIIDLHKIIIQQDMMILNNTRKVRYYTTKKRILLEELSVLMSSCPEDEYSQDVFMLETLEQVSRDMEASGDHIAELIRCNDYISNYL